MPKSFRHACEGSVSVLAAWAFPMLIGVTGLAVEYGDALLTKVKVQRVADAAAYSGALAYVKNSSTDAMNAAISRVATLNGIASSAAVGALVNSPTGDGNQAVQVTVTSNVPLGLSKQVNTGLSQASVAASAYAELKSTGQACLIGLASGGTTTAVKEDAGATLTGSSCAIASRSNLAISGGATMRVQGVYAKGSATTSGGATITTTPVSNNINQNYSGSITDPVAGNSSVQAAFSNLSSLSGTVSNPTTPASTVALQFNWSPSGPSDPTYPYYSGTGGVYNKGTLPCSSGSYAIKSISVSGGVSVHISATAGCNYTVTNGVTVSGNLLQIDGTAGSWYINGGISTGSNQLVMNAGSFWIGGGISVGGSGVLTLANGSTIYVNGGITTGGGSTTTLTANVYQVSGVVNLSGTVNWRTTSIAPTTNFYSTLGLGSGGGTFTFGDGTYYVNGNVTLSSGPTYFGNSLLEINGNLVVSSGASMCGSPAPCGSGTTHMTIVDNGTNTFSGGSTANLQAPASGATNGIPGVLMASNYTSAVTTYAQMFSGGTSGTYAGVLYFPNSSIEFSGGANTGGSSCFEIVANAVYFTGGSATASTCSGFGANIGSATALLVQ
jgi:Flp pilus assembly protein TadG